MNQRIKLQESDGIFIEFEGHDETLRIKGNGDIGYDMGNHGSNVNLFDDGRETGAWTDPERALCKSSYPELQSRADTPSKLDKIERYLHMLYHAQSADHRVDKEIDGALEEFRKEAGI